VTYVPALFTASGDRVEVDREPNAVLLFGATPNVVVRSEVAVQSGMVQSGALRNVKAPSVVVLNVEIQNARVRSEALRIGAIQIAMVQIAAPQSAVVLNVAPQSAVVLNVAPQSAVVLNVAVLNAAVQLEATQFGAARSVVQDVTRVVPISVRNAVRDAAVPFVFRVLSRS
jgi:hypothetical protein